MIATNETPTPAVTTPEAASTAPEEASAPPRPPGPHGIRVTWPTGRTTAGRLGSLGPRARKTGERLVTALWVAHRAARKLRSAMKKHRPDDCPRIQTACCGSCGHNAAACKRCEMLDLLNALIGQDATVRLGEAAELASQMLPWFDVERRVQEVDRAFAEMFKKDAAKELPGPTPGPARAEENAAQFGKSQTEPDRAVGPEPSPANGVHQQPAGEPTALNDAGADGASGQTDFNEPA